MSMTTLLTLSSMFSSLTTITPPISYTTKLDIWMVSCIIFVFATLLEFTVVIFLKYYLKHLPAIQFDRAFSGASSRSKSVIDVKTRVQSWVKVTTTFLISVSSTSSAFRVPLQILNFQLTKPHSDYRTVSPYKALPVDDENGDA
jgi:hypothetical protein